MTQLDLHAEFQRADVALAMGRPAEAARIVERVVVAEPANQAALELLARACFGAARLGRAEEALARLVALAPANGWAHRALARTLERQSRADEAAVHHRLADALGAARRDQCFAAGPFPPAERHATPRERASGRVRATGRQVTGTGSS